MAMRVAGFRRGIARTGAAVALAAAIGAQATAGTAWREVEVQDRKLPVAVRVPEGYDPGRAWPLVVFLHGAGECGSDGAQVRVGLGPAVEARPGQWPCLVVMPQKPRRDREWEDYEDLVLAAIADVRAAYNIDPGRISLTGLSQGGHGTWEIGARHPGLFSCLAPVCGYGDEGALAPRIAGLPVWAFHGLRDDVVRPDATIAIIGEVRRLRREAGADPQGARLTLYPDAGHDSWTAAYAEPEFPGWLLGQSRAEVRP